MKHWVKSNDVVVLKADKSRPSAEIDQLLLELGNATKGLPYYALMRPNEAPIHFNGGYASTTQFLAQLGEVPVNNEEGGQVPVKLED